MDQEVNVKNNSYVLQKRYSNPCRGYVHLLMTLIDSRAISHLSAKCLPKSDHVSNVSPMIEFCFVF